jgi:phosphatidylglycerophosphatase A
MIVHGRRHAASSAVISDPFHLLAFGFGSGLIRFAPGTAGTVAAVPIFIAAHELPLMLYVALIAVMFLAGVWICGRASLQLGVHDHSGIVWDEIVGFLLAMTAAPAGWAWILVGAVLFRVFDIAKPWPVSLADRRLGGGFGIMLDDTIAGLYSLAALQALAGLT